MNKLPTNDCNPWPECEIMEIMNSLPGFQVNAVPGEPVRLQVSTLYGDDLDKLGDLQRKLERLGTIADILAERRKWL